MVILIDSNDSFDIPNNNQGISLAYACTHFLFSTGVANSLASSKFFSGRVGVGAIATGLAGGMKTLKYLLNGNKFTNIFVGFNVLSNTSSILNTKIDTKEKILSFNAPLTRTINTIGIDLNSYVPFTALAFCNYVTNSTTGLLNYCNKTESDGRL